MLAPNNHVANCAVFKHTLYTNILFRSERGPKNTEDFDFTKQLLY